MRPYSSHQHPHLRFAWDDGLLADSMRLASTSRSCYFSFGSWEGSRLAYGRSDNLSPFVCISSVDQTFRYVGSVGILQVNGNHLIVLIVLWIDDVYAHYDKLTRLSNLWQLPITASITCVYLNWPLIFLRSSMARRFSLNFANISNTRYSVGVFFA